MTKHNPTLRAHNFKDFTGQTFYYITLDAYDGTVNKRAMWRGHCKCGNPVRVTSHDLLSGHTRSCGCLALEVRTKHGQIKKVPTRETTREYRAWQAAKRRCFGLNYAEARNYSGRGITMCEQWKNDFLAFLDYVGKCPPGYTLDRYPDNNGNYEPGNVRWATRKQQNANQRRTVMITFNGLTLPRTQWTERLGFKRETLRDRLRRGWSLDRAMSTPENHD